MFALLAFLAAQASAAGLDLWIKGAGGSTMHYQAGWTDATTAGDIKTWIQTHSNPTILKADTNLYYQCPGCDSRTELNDATALGSIGINNDPIPIIVMEDKNMETVVESHCDVSHMTCTVKDGRMEISHQNGEKNTDQGQFFCKMNGHGRLKETCSCHCKKHVINS